MFQLESSQEFSFFMAGSELLFSLGLQLIGWGPPSLGEEVVPFTQVYPIQMLISFRKTLSQTHPEYLIKCLNI